MHSIHPTCSLILTSVLLASTVVCGGCQEMASPSEDTGADGIDGVDASDAASDTAPEPPEPIPMRYLLVGDRSEEDHTINAGADIDAIILDKADGRRLFARRVVAFGHGGGTLEIIDVDVVLDEPDAFYDWPDVSVCDLDCEHYLSLGGPGGYVAVDFGGDVLIEPGDVVTVLEIGGCTGNEGAAGIVEAVEIRVAPEPDAPDDWPVWVTIGEGLGPEIRVEVPLITELPLTLDGQRPYGPP